VVTTVSRALASLVVLALFLVGAPLSPNGSALAATAGVGVLETVGTAAEQRGAREDSQSDRTLLTEHDSGAVAIAHPGWSTDHRVPVRDLPDAYSPVLPWVDDLGAPWALVPPPGSEAAPDPADPFALPFGRAPPLTERM